MRLGYCLFDYNKYGLKIPINIVVPLKNSNILIAGKSGSGKSCSTLYYLWNLLSTGESIVYLADYKGGTEYETFEGSCSYASGKDAIRMIDNYYDFFTEVRNHRIRLKNHYTLIIEEWLGILTYAETQSKKLKNDLLAKVGELLAVSRGLNLGIIICVQRADASLFNTGAREQFQCVLSFGRCSAEQFRMLGFSGELEVNPTQHYKAGQALALIDGQDCIQEIVVPFIKNSDEMCSGIRTYLDRQPSIQSLIQTIAEGKSMD